MITNYNNIYGDDWPYLRTVEPFTNWTDPFVEFDPSSGKTLVAKAYSPEDGNDDGRQGTEQSSLKIDGVMVPIIQINNHVVSSSDIVSMKLYYDGMFPTVDVCILDRHGLISFSDKPGFDNNLTLIMTMPGEITYKKISIDFYITSYDTSGEYIYLSGDYKLMPLEQIQLKQITCTNPDCPNDKPSTWEFLWQVAKDCNLGFASTDSCKDIKDDRYRICRGKKLKEYIKECIEYAGTDENSIFDCWVDLFGYIVLVNVSWLMTVKVDMDMLSIKINSGKRNNGDNTNDTTWTEVNRMLNNFSDQPSENNMMIASYEDLTNNNIYESGSTKHYNAWGMAGAQGDVNKLDQHDVVYKENSVEGQKYAKNYNDFQRWFFSGIEMSDGVPVLKQRSLRSNYLNRKRARVLKVTLAQANWGLQRGTLVNVSIFETEFQKKQKILTSMDSIVTDTEESEEKSDFEYSEDMEEMMNDNMENINKADAPLLNPRLSGMYYIDKMEFEFADNAQHIIQTLYLIQKYGLIETNFSSKTAPDRYSKSLDGDNAEVPEPNK